MVSFVLLPADFKPKGANGFETETVAGFAFLKDYLGPLLRKKWPHYLVFTPTGFVNSSAFLACLTKAIEIWDTIHPGLRALWLGDNLEPHRAYEVLELVASTGLHLNGYIPACTSNFLAMPDEEPYGELKIIGEKEAERSLWDELVSGTKWGFGLLASFLEAELKAFTPQVCLKGFKSSGLLGDDLKFNKQRVLELITKNLGPFNSSSPDVKAQAREATTAILDKANKTSKKRVLS